VGYKEIVHPKSHGTRLIIPGRHTKQYSVRGRRVQKQENKKNGTSLKRQNSRRQGQLQRVNFREKVETM
jgi:hypothetical protein